MSYGHETKDGKDPKLSVKSSPRANSSVQQFSLFVVTVRIAWQRIQHRKLYCQTDSVTFIKTLLQNTGGDKLNDLKKKEEKNP